MISIGEFIKQKQGLNLLDLTDQDKRLEKFNISGSKVDATVGYKEEVTPIQRIKKEVSRKASLANKRLRRLEDNNLTKLPAYQQWVDYKGGVKFSVAGKDYNELQKELARVNRFIDAKTSLVRQANRHLKEVADLTGISYSSVKELPKKTEKFFELASKVEQYLRNVEGSASAIGYHKIWNVINEYVEDEELDLSDARVDMESVLAEIIDLSKYDIEDGYLAVDMEEWINV